MEHGPADEIRPALRAGRLQGFGLPDLLWSLCRARVTGVLRVARGEIEKAVYVDGGRIIFASSSDPDDRLGELLLRGGVVGIDELEQAIERLGSGKRLGTLLVEDGSLQPDQLVAAVLEQVEAIVLDLFSWDQGDYRFEAGPLPTDEVIKLTMKTGELLMRGIRQLGSFVRVRRSVGSSHKVYGLTERWRESLEGVTLTAGEESLVERLEEGDTGLDELCREVFLSNFEIYQTVWALKVLGVVEERDEPWMAPSDVSRRGSLAQVEFAELLVELARGGDTGVLYVSQGEHERSFHISGGRCIFATSNNPDDGLLCYLLRRGVISLRDREETAKRLLSNKRVGTILCEMGVIDEQDLRRMVRDQLSEIVYDTFRWTEAEYAFVAGPLPTVEEITLEEDLDALVARGTRRVDSWARVWQGCGGLDVTLELKPSYLKVLDAMGAGPDEWQVIAALKEPRTARQICRRLALADFRVCQILWCMRVLGGLEVSDTGAPETSAGEPAAETPSEMALAVESADGHPRETSIEETIQAMEISLEDAPAVAPARHREPTGPVEVEVPADEAAFEPQPVEAEVPADEVAFEPRPVEVEVPADEAAFEPRPVEAEVPADEVAFEPRPVEAEVPADEVAVEPRPVEAEVPVDEAAFEPQPVEVEASADEAAFEPQAVEAEVPADEAAFEPQPAVPDRMLETPEAEASPEATQVLSREQVEAAIAGPTAPEARSEPGEAQAEPSPEATQVIPRDLIEAAVSGTNDEPPIGDELLPVQGEHGIDVEAPEPPRPAVELEARDVEHDGSGEADPVSAVALEETAITGEVDAVADDDWDPGVEVDRTISRFNAAQRVVYRTIRSEVGAGAANFIRSCFAHLAGSDAAALCGVDLQADGSWDAAGLRSAIRALRLEDPSDVYRKLIEREIDQLRMLIGDSRASELQRQVEQVAGVDAGQQR